MLPRPVFVCCHLILTFVDWNLAKGNVIRTNGKMAAISICLNGKCKRLKVEGVNINSKVAGFRSKVSHATEVPIHEIGKNVQNRILAILSPMF